MIITTEAHATALAAANQADTDDEVATGEIAENDEFNWTYAVIEIPRGYAVAIYDRYQIFVGMV